MIQPSESIGASLPPNQLTMNELWLRNVRDHASTLALVCTHQPFDLYGISDAPAGEGDDGKRHLRWTYGDVEHAVERFSSGLRRRGLKKGDTVLTFMTNSAEFVISTWAAYRIGLIHVPINPKNLFYDQEIRHMLKTAMIASQPATLAIIAGTADLCMPVEKLVTGLNCIKILIEFQGSENGWASFEDLMQSPNEIFEEDQSDIKIHEAKEQSLFFTSGTTSLPKGCLLQASAYAHTLATDWSQGENAMSPGDKFALVLPNNHAFFYGCLMSCFVNAATIVFPGSGFIPEMMIEAIQREQCQYTALVPTMVLALSISQKSPMKKLSSLRRIILAGAPPTEEVVRTCLEDLGASGVQNEYGMTEGTLTNTRVARNPSDIVVSGNVLLGKPLPGSKIRICAQGSTIPLPVGSSGEMHFCGPSLVEKYIGIENDDSFYIGNDGGKWFRTGDKVFMGNDGQLYLVGRFKETIIRGGENIEPSSIEAILCQSPEFYALEPQIVKCPDHIAGEVPIAVINCEIDQTTAQRLRTMISQSMGTLYVPAKTISLQSLGLKDFPRTMGGKIQKKRLEELVEKQCSQSASPDVVSDEATFGSQIVSSLLSAIEQQSGASIDMTTRMIDLGIDSITSIAINHQIRKETGVSLPSSLFFTQTTIGVIQDSLNTISNPMEILDFTVPTTDEPPELCFSALIQGTPKPGQPALFLLPPGSGYAFSYDTLPKLSNDIAVYSLGSPFFMTESEGTWSVEEASAIYARTIRHIQSEGPYLLSGWSMGAILAYEVAFQLTQQGQRILGVISIDMDIGPPPTSIVKIPELSVELLTITGFYPPIYRKGKPDMEIPGYRKRHSVSSIRAKMRYFPRPMSLIPNPSPVRVFIIWAAHGDHDRLLDVLNEADHILKKHGRHTKLRASQEWLRIPRAQFDSGGWAELVGEGNVDFHIIPGAAHDSMFDSGIVEPVAAQMELTIQTWLKLPFP